jgi:hypothetical protein
VETKPSELGDATRPQKSLPIHLSAPRAEVGGGEGCAQDTGRSGLANTICLVWLVQLASVQVESPCPLGGNARNVSYL